MPIIDKQKWDAAQRSFSTIFNGAFAAAPDAWKQVAMEIQSTAAAEDYVWLGEVPTVKEWISDRSFQSLKAYQYQIKNKSWEVGIEVSRDDIEDDKLGMVPPRIRDLAQKAKKHYSDLIWALLVNGFTSTGYDGQFFFDTDHGDAGNISNKHTAVLAAASFDLMVAAMMQIKDDQGRDFIDVVPTHLVVPPQLRSVAKGIVEVERLASGASNPNYKAVELIVEPRLAAHPTKWFLLDLRRELKPFILQVRRPFEFIAQDNEAVHEQAFMRKVFRYGVDGRHNAGYGLWQLAFGSTGTV